MLIQNCRIMPGFIKTLIAIVVIISLLNGIIPISGIGQNDSRIACIDPELEIQPVKEEFTTEIDSSHERSGRNLLSFNTGKDTFVCNDFDMNGYKEMNFGAEDTIYVAYEDTAYNYFPPLRGLIKFDFSGIPTNTEIISANMKLYYGESIEGESVPLAITAYPLTCDWVEGTGTWEQYDDNAVNWKTYDGKNAWNTPGGDYDDQMGVAATTPGNFGWVTWDIKNIFQEWSDGTIENHGVILISKTEPTQPTVKLLNSFNGANNKPVLEIRYNKPPTAIIDSVEPNPVKEFRNVTFTGHGDDPDDGTTNSGFIWMLKNDYIPTIVVGNEAISTVDNLTHGSYEVSFRVKDNFGVWSPDVTLNEPLVVSADEAPAKIDDLIAEAHGGLSGAINLTWKAVAEDGLRDDGKASRYIIKYSDTYMDSLASFNNAEDLDSIIEIPEPKKPGGREEITITGYNKGSEHFFAVIAEDERGQRSPISNVVRAIAPDHNPPDGILDLNAESGKSDGEIDLMWTAPGDDGIDGQAHKYQIKCSKDRIRTIWDFYSADDVPNSDEVPSPNPAGSRESFTVTGLERRETYYFAIKTMDKWDNIGPLSKVAEAMATDKMAPSMVTGVVGFDTPDDLGQSITINWNISPEEDLHHYSIYVAMTPITDVSLITPVKTIDKNQGTKAIIRSQDMSLVDRREYYVAVTAADDYNNMKTEVISYGPIMSLNNLKKAQPLLDPERGTTYENKAISENPAVDIEITKLDVTINTEEIDDKFVSITTSYEIEGISTVPGDQIDHIDVYDHMRDGEDDWDWSPLMDQVAVEDLDDTETDYVDKLYELFFHPDISQDIWSLSYQYSRIVEKEELALLGIGENPENYGVNQICIVTWTVTAEWNYLVQEYEQKVISTWVDSDRDGLADKWEEKYFESITKYFALDDADGDGFSNLLEFQENSIPTDANSYPQGTPDKTIVDPVNKKSSGLEDKGWLLLAILVIIIIGIVVIAVILVVKKSKARRSVEPVKFPEESSTAPVPQKISETPVEPDIPKTAFIPPVVQTQSLNQDDCETCGKPLEYDSHTGDWYCQTCESDPNSYVDIMVAEEAERTAEFPEPAPFLALPPHLVGTDENEVGVESEEGRKTLEQLQEARAMLEKAPSFIDVTEPKAILDRAAVPLKDNDIGKASASIEESTKLAYTIRERYGELVKQSEKILKDANLMKEQETDISRIEELFTSGKSALMAGDFNLCEENFKKALKVIDTAKESSSKSSKGIVEDTSALASATSEEVKGDQSYVKTSKESENIETSEQTGPTETPKESQDVETSEQTGPTETPKESEDVETLEHTVSEETTEEPENVEVPEEPEPMENTEEPESMESPAPVSSVVTVKEKIDDDNLDDMLDGLLEDL